MLHATVHRVADDTDVGSLQRADLLPLSVSFEAVAVALETLPRMFFEPDGSFLWVSDDAQAPWQLDGQLQDQGASLDHVEIKGTCSLESFRAFLQTLRGNNEQLVFQLVAERRFVDEATAQRLIAPEG